MYGNHFRCHWHGGQYSDENGAKTSVDATSLVPNLLATCKQIHSEAIGYLYKQTIILEDVSDPYHANTYTEEIAHIVQSHTVMKNQHHRRVSREAKSF